MNKSITFGRILSRIVFILLILILVSTPRLRSTDPGPVFSQIRTLLSSIPIPVWILFFAISIFLLWVITRRSKLDESGTIERDPKEKLSISEVVMPKNGGNGLTSVAYSPTLPFLGILGWVEVKDPDKECIVIDGKHKLGRTQLYFSPMILFGKPINARRILLAPPPLEDIKATALTNDQLELTLVVSVKYSISNPIYVASLSAPLSELNNLITGVIVEQIHTHSLEDIVKDDGSLRSMLEKKISESNSIKNNFKIDEVLKALPTGDERIIEIIRQTREAIKKGALIKQEGENKTIVAGYDITIKKREAELKDEFEQRQHGREMEMLRMQNQFEAMREVMRAIAQVAASGVNPAPAIREIRSILNQTQSEPEKVLPKTTTETIDLIQRETKNLEVVQSKIGYKSFKIEPSVEKTDQPGSALIEFDDYSVKIDCSDEYPEAAPEVFIQTEMGDSTSITIPWFIGNNLVDVVTSVAMQESVKKPKKRKKVE
jgi:hypothetical protein